MGLDVKGCIYDKHISVFSENRLTEIFEDDFNFDDYFKHTRSVC